MRRAAYLAALLACSCERASLDAADYDQSCTGVGDCVEVLAGDLCACGTPAAINTDAQAAFEEDAQTLRATCFPGPLGIAGDCFFDALQLSCVDGTCAMTEVPRLPVFSWGSPVQTEVVPTNVLVTGRIVAGSDPSELLRAVVLTGEESRELEAGSAHCAVIGGCETVYALGPLPANSMVTLRFQPSAPGMDVSWTTGEGPDLTPPTIGELTVESVGVHRDETRRMFKHVDLGYVVPVDDSGIADFGLLRSVDGAQPVLVERIAAWEIGPRASDEFAEDSGAREACYSFLAWDWAGNEAQSDPVCVDVTISDEEQQSIPSCGATGGSASLLALSFALRRGRRRRGRRDATMPR